MICNDNHPSQLGIFEIFLRRVSRNLRAKEQRICHSFLSLEYINALLKYFSKYLIFLRLTSHGNSGDSNLRFLA